MADSKTLKVRYMVDNNTKEKILPVTVSSAIYHTTGNEYETSSDETSPVQRFLNEELDDLSTRIGKLQQEGSPTDEVTYKGITSQDFLKIRETGTPDSEINSFLANTTKVNVHKLLPSLPAPSATPEQPLPDNVKDDANYKKTYSSIGDESHLFSNIASTGIFIRQKEDAEPLLESVETETYSALHVKNLYPSQSHSSKNPSNLGSKTWIFENLWVDKINGIKFGSATPSDSKPVIDMSEPLAQTVNDLATRISASDVLYDNKIGFPNNLTDPTSITIDNSKSFTSYLFLNIMFYKIESNITDVKSSIVIPGGFFSPFDNTKSISWSWIEHSSDSTNSSLVIYDGKIKFVNNNSLQIYDYHVDSQDIYLAVYGVINPYTISNS